MLVLLTALAAVVGAGVVWALPVPTTGNWVVYQSSNGGPVRMSQAEAAEDYFQISANNAGPTSNGRCWRYFFEGAGTNRDYPNISFQFVSGKAVRNCSWPSANGSVADQTTGIAVPVTCYNGKNDDRCYRPFDDANERNAGPVECKSGQCGVGNPVNVGTGNKYEAVTDFVVPGSPHLAFTRYYNSQEARAFGYAMGNYWRHSFDYQVQSNGGGAYSLLRPTGEVKRFGANNNVPADERGVFGPTFAANGDINGFVYDDNESQVETYNVDGYLTRIDFRTGGFVQLGYTAGKRWATSVVDNFGRALTLAYDTSGTRLMSVTTPRGAQYSYGYDNYARLTSRTAPGNAVRQYVYDVTSLNPTTRRGLLNQTKDELGTVIGEYAYDSRGRAIRTQGAGGVNKFTMTYTDGSAATVTSPLNAVTTLGFSNVLSTPRNTSGTTVCNGAGCTTPSASGSTYDANGNRTSFSTGNGFKTCVAYDLTRNLPWRTVEGVSDSADCASVVNAPPAALPALTTTMEWHPTFPVLTRTVTATTLTTITPDAQGRPLQVSTVATNGNGTGSEGFSVATAGVARTTTLTYNAAGQVLTVDGPRTDVNDTTTFDYDTSGNLLTVTNPVGQVTTFSNYDADGRAWTITQPNGVQVSLTYSLRGQLLTQAIAGATTTYGYDARGLLTTETRPSGQVLTYGYDAAHRLSSITDQRGNSQQLALNAAGGATQMVVKTSAGAVVTQLNQTFDALNRVLTRTGAHSVNPLDGLLTP